MWFNRGSYAEYSTFPTETERKQREAENAEEQLEYVKKETERKQKEAFEEGDFTQFNRFGKFIG